MISSLEIWKIQLHLGNLENLPLSYLPLLLNAPATRLAGLLFDFMIKPSSGAVSWISARYNCDHGVKRMVQRRGERPWRRDEGDINTGLRCLQKARVA